MEALLSLAFDNLSSYDGPKVRKGLRQVEGLLAQICLSSPNGKGPSRDSKASTPAPQSDDAASSPKKNRTLAELSGDPAFREFFKLQEGFEWNVALRLVGTLDRLLAKGADGQNDLLILSTLDLIQGVLLLHPPSKSLFEREVNMNMLLDLLEPVNCPAIQSATLLTLVVALLDCPANTRAFEALDGLLTVTSLFKSRSTSREVKLKLVEFLYFYLMPETPAVRVPAASMPAAPNGLALGDGKSGHHRSPSKLALTTNGAAARRQAADFGIDGLDDEYCGTLSTEEKQALLGKHLSNVEDLVKDLRHCTPFGGVVC